MITIRKIRRTADSCDVTVEVASGDGVQVTNTYIVKLPQDTENPHREYDLIEEKLIEAGLYIVS